MIYEVNPTLEKSISKQYAEIVQRHIQIILKLEGFLDAKWYRVDPIAGESDSKISWCIQYFVRDRASLEAYLKGPAVALRAETRENFGDCISITRRILDEV